MKSLLFPSLIVTALTLTACDNEADKATPASEQLIDTDAKATSNISTIIRREVKEVSQSTQEATADSTAIIENNLQSIEENLATPDTTEIIDSNLQAIKEKVATPGATEIIENNLQPIQENLESNP